MCAEDEFMKVPCKHCPFRSDVTPYLRTSRAEQLAYAAQNHYNSFTCHKTTEYNEDTEDQEIVPTSKECAGFLTLVAQECGEEVLPEGFVPSYKMVYIDAYDMVGAHEEKNGD